jgi:hypothetical protein
MTIRADRRVLGGLGLLVVLGIAVWLGMAMGQNPAAPSTSPAGDVASLVTQPAVPGTAPGVVPESASPADDPGSAATTAAEEAAEAAVPRIQLADAVAKLGQPSVLFVDARSLSDFDASHIKGAVSLPVGEVEARLGELPPDKEIIFYCA